MRARELVNDELRQMRDMKENRPNYSDFKDSLVAFIDVLGFNNRVKSIKNGDDFFEVSNLLYATKLTADGLSGADGVLDGFTITSISDSIIVTAPFNHPYCTVTMLHILHHIQYEFIATSFRTLVRGYITRGPVYHKDGMLFGSGYSDAYRGEGLIGWAPRIVLEPKVVKDAMRVVSQHGENRNDVVTAFDYLKEDPYDGFHFIDYFKPVGNQSVLSKEHLLDERREIQLFIEQNLQTYRDDYKIYPKYKWLQSYHASCSEYFTDDNA